MAVHIANNEPVFDLELLGTQPTNPRMRAHKGIGRNVERSKKHKLGVCYADCTCIECLAAFTPEERAIAAKLHDQYEMAQREELYKAAKKALLRERSNKG